MKINSLLSKVDIFPEKKEIAELKLLAKVLIKELKTEIKKKKIKADVFSGGSFAKDTLLKGKNYDVDIYVRFENKNQDISKKLKPIAHNVARKLKKNVEDVHGSRDYYRIIINPNLYFEIIPVLKISNPKYAENVTDLSYFHVKYVKSKLKSSKQIREVLLLKALAKASGIYGAESYIGGISGYGAECLIINYKSLANFAKKIIKSEGKIIIDPAKKYKNSQEALLNLNESKLKSPIVLVDPTYKERNVLAALSDESFLILKDKLKKLISNPSVSLFKSEENVEEKIKKTAKDSELEFIKIELETDKQAGDIAGTKLKKFSKFIQKEIEKYFNIIKSNFEYNKEHTGILIIACKSKDEIIQTGPPLYLKEHVLKFKNNHPNAYVKDNILYTKIKLDKNIKEFIERYYLKNKKIIESMDIKQIKILN